MIRGGHEDIEGDLLRGAKDEDYVTYLTILGLGMFGAYVIYRNNLAILIGNII